MAGNTNSGKVNRKLQGWTEKPLPPETVKIETGG